TLTWRLTSSRELPSPTYTRANAGRAAVCRHTCGSLSLGRACLAGRGGGSPGALASAGRLVALLADPDGPGAPVTRSTAAGDAAGAGEQEGKPAGERRAGHALPAPGAGAVPRRSGHGVGTGGGRHRLTPFP